jgi:hypothetical protein
MSYQRHQKSIWFKGDFLDKSTYGEIYGAKERSAYGLY